MQLNIKKLFDDVKLASNIIVTSMHVILVFALVNVTRVASASYVGAKVKSSIRVMHPADVSTFTLATLSAACVLFIGISIGKWLTTNFVLDVSEDNTANVEYARMNVLTPALSKLDTMCRFCIDMLIINICVMVVIYSYNIDFGQMIIVALAIVINSKKVSD